MKRITHYFSHFFKTAPVHVFSLTCENRISTLLFVSEMCMLYLISGANTSCNCSLSRVFRGCLPSRRRLEELLLPWNQLACVVLARTPHQVQEVPRV